MVEGGGICNDRHNDREDTEVAAAVDTPIVIHTGPMEVVEGTNYNLMVPWRL